MVSVDPGKRPTVEEVLNNVVFARWHCKRCYSAPASQEEGRVQVQTKIGPKGKWKPRYLALANKHLFVYNSKEAKKAKLSYPCRDCKLLDVAPADDASTGTSDSRKSSSLSQSEPQQQLKIEHELLETLQLSLETPEQMELVDHLRLATTASAQS